MRLKHIKIAGFKSFVDVTTIPLPQNMTCIVGPNGCGKSNTIDAVRWVMGESSAKHLRGESMTDVIFAGSSGRKPVSQASVELLFDNSDRQILGEYAQYDEIAVKRVVTRDGQSNYYLNNVKCRRRDVTHLFLGTGLGPRSYAIIEQGMISHLIEAKPDELRVYLEEAAGISKYKERRRETELRMKRTRENLERLHDLRDELERQLKRLAKQAEDAKAFKALQAEKRRKQAELAWIKRRSLANVSDQLTQTIRAEEVKLEALYAQRREVQTKLEVLSQQLIASEQNFHSKQKAFYTVGNELSKLEEAQRYRQQRQGQLDAERLEAQANMAQVQGHQQADQERLTSLKTQLAEHEPELEILDERVEQAADRFEQAQLDYEQWQQQWQQHIQASSESRETAQVAQVTINAQENTLTRLRDRQDQIRLQLTDLNMSEVRQRLDEARRHFERLSSQGGEVEQQLAQSKLALTALIEQRSILQRQISDQHAKHDQAKGEYTSLAKVQEASLRPNDQAQQRWLDQHELQDQPLLAQRLKVPSQWQSAVESLFGSLLVARCEIPDPWKLHDQPSPVQTFLLGAIRKPSTTTCADQMSTRATLKHASTGVELQSLIDILEIEPTIALPGWIFDVYLAQDSQQAEQFATSLQPMQSILTQQGVWLGPGWAMVGKGQAASGLLVRKQDLAILSEHIETLQATLTCSEATCTALDTQVGQAQANLEQQQHSLQEHRALMSQSQQQIAGLGAKDEQFQLQHQRLEEEQRLIEQQLKQELTSLNEQRNRLEIAVERMAEFEDARTQLEAQQDQLTVGLGLAREALQQDQNNARTLEQSIQIALASVQSIEQQLARLNEQAEQNQRKEQQLAQELSQLHLATDESQHLSELVASRAELEQTQAEAKDLLESQRSLQRHCEQQLQSAQSAIERLRSELEQLRIKAQARASDLSHIDAELAQYELSNQALAEALPADARPRDWQQAIDTLEQQVQKLGAINLAAVEEFEAQSERKQYLDDQHLDLETALFTLEAAIEQIDQETRERFFATFERVNTGMSELFPRLFGGGHAHLQLVGDDVLSAGVAIMARPPGKKNSSIHMLSGGEKALTAISLVFAIFQLNPAPFCMLDEVDAPLDDANVGRYANMVKHMSEQVQFIYISHNKIAMEQADQLMGVTMQEPGVSRLVSVDVGEASALAAL